MTYNIKLENKEDIIAMINILGDAREYHAIHLQKRRNKNYKQKNKKSYNKKMIEYHEAKINEIYRLINDIVNKSGIYEVE